MHDTCTLLIDLVTTQSDSGIIILKNVVSYSDGHGSHWYCMPNLVWWLMVQ